MNIKTTLAEKIAGEITLSPKAGQTIRKWRNLFDITQTQLASFLKVSPSVISDYESGRRQSPGIQTVKKIIDAFLDIDEKRGGTIVRRYQAITKTQEGVMELIEYPYEIPAEVFIKQIEGNILSSKAAIKNKHVKGFTLIDSIKTIENINTTEYTYLYGWNPERALIFTGIRYGRSPMVAVRVHPVKPTLVVFHKPGAVDPLAITLAERENIPLIVTDLPLDVLKKKLVLLGE
jgi:putative transcriptional regulator